MLTEDMENTEMHRIVIRGIVHERRRPKSSRFGGGSITNSFNKKRYLGASLITEWYSYLIGDFEFNWIGSTWKKRKNKGKMPSLKQVEDGLIAEAMVQLVKQMGDTKSQLLAFSARDNIKKEIEDRVTEGKEKLESKAEADAKNNIK